MNAKNPLWCAPRLAAFTGAIVSPSSHAQITGPPYAKAAPTTVVIPFDPPLDTDLRYRVTRTRPSGASIITQTLRFTRSADGYVMTLSNAGFNIGDELAMVGGAAFANDPRIPAALGFDTVAVSFDLDSKGKILRLRDWDTVRATTTKNIGIIAGVILSNPASQHATSMADAARAHYANINAEQAAVIWLKHWNQLLRLGGAEAEDGKTVAGRMDGDTEVGSSSIPVSTRIRFTLSSDAQANLLHVVISTSADYEKVDRAIENYTRQIVEEANGRGVTSQVRLGSLSKRWRITKVGDEIDARIDRATGLPVSALITGSLTTRGSTGRSTTQIELID